MHENQRIAALRIRPPRHPPGIFVGVYSRSCSVKADAFLIARFCFTKALHDELGSKMKSTQRMTGGKLRIHQSLARELGIAILSGKYAPGDILGGEIERSHELGVSRTAYREAMRILVAKGLIMSRPKAGSRVTPRNRWNLLDPEMLSWMFSGEPDEKFIGDLFELRYIIEPAAAYIAAERRSDEHVITMREALEDMRQFGLEKEEGQAADRRFHHVLIAATANSALATLSVSIGSAVQWTTNFKQRRSAQPRDSIPDHEDVFQAIEASDCEAAMTAMRKLLWRARQDIDAVKPRPA